MNFTISFSKYCHLPPSALNEIRLEDEKEKIYERYHLKCWYDIWASYRDYISFCEILLKNFGLFRQKDIQLVIKFLQRIFLSSGISFAQSYQDFETI